MMYFLEVRGLMSIAQSGFRRRSAMDALVTVSTETAKALTIKYVMSVVYFDIEKVYNNMWREELLIKLSALGIGVRVFNWIIDFLFNRVIRVRMGSELSMWFEVENGTPQGSVVSPVLFTLMIDYIFKEVGHGVGVALYADDVCKRGGNVKYVIRKLWQL
jgi:hypothetical protein